ncbi:MAG: leucyl/phenylalanyl-tRNA--protein transferase [Myxococcales bacterium]|nr:leucyl/phenylalanyl-tRNA--protein transferase [Myxococcales bacterium]
MGIPWLTQALEFPDPQRADAEGIVAAGGDCSVERLLLAYRSGIFPWPINARMPLLWFSPDPRYVVVPREAHVGRTIRKQVRRGLFEVRVDTAFREVMLGCAKVHRPGQRGTWITPELLNGYLRLFEAGYAHSIEAWEGGRLVGGLYGLALGKAFFGESMFAERPDASKVAFSVLLGHMIAWDFHFVDCQTHTEHLARFGAVPWSRTRYLAALGEAVQHPDPRGRWQWALSADDALALVPG